MSDTRQQYNTHARAYHEKRLNESDSLWNRYLDFPMVETLLGELPKGHCVLDLGCGSGFLSRWLHERGLAVCGLDFSEKLIEIARQECPQVDFAVGDITATPYPDDSFDTVVSALVLHYLQDLRPAFAETARILRPGGVLVFTIHHPFMEVLDLESTNDTLSATARPYFHNEPYTWQMLSGMTLNSYHHTFETIFAGLSASGFVVENLLEGRFPESLQETYPKDFARTNTYPSFCGLRTRLTKRL